MAPIRRKQLHIASESFANARRIFILGRWLNDGAETIRASWSASSGKEEKAASTLCSEVMSHSAVVMFSGDELP